MRPPLLPLLLSLLLGAGLPSSARAMTAADARSQSFKLQSEGMKFYREGKFPEAIEAFRKVVNMHLNSFMAWYYLGASLVAERLYGDAIEPLKVALDLQPDYIQAHLVLGDAYLKHGETDEARASYLRALDLQPNYAPGHDGLGRLYESVGKDDEAEAEYRKAIEINVAFADAYTHLGELFLRKSRLDEATALFMKAIAMKPDFSQAYTRLGVALSRQGRYDDAIAAARKSQSLTPRDPEPYVALARIYIDLQSFQRAQDSLKSALDLDPSHVWAQVVQADLRRAQGDLSGALQGLQARYEKGIDDPRQKRLVQEMLKSLRSDNDRYAALQAAVDTNPMNPEATADLARFLSAQKAHGKAAELLEGAAMSAGGNKMLLFEAATEYLAGWRLAKSMTLFEQFSRADGGAPGMRADALFNLGVARSAAGLDTEAAQAFREYLSMRAEDPQAILYLGNCYLRLGRKEEARASYAAFLEKSLPGQDADNVKRLLQGLSTPQTAGTKP